MSVPIDWEALRHMTLDQLVTSTKLGGTVTRITGWTTPEGWPYAIVVAIGKPGHAAIGVALAEFEEKVRATGVPLVKDDRRYPPGQMPEDGGKLPLVDAGFEDPPGRRATERTCPACDSILIMPYRGEAMCSNPKCSYRGSQGP